MTPTIVFDTYWRFAAERLAMYYRRLADPVGRCTDDPILSGFRFTNTYRAADRVSQYLISEVQAGADRSQDPREVFFRTILFKIFNRIETWEALEQRLGPLTWTNLNAAALDQTLENLRRRGNSIYSAAYIMPSPSYGRERKHSNHIALLLQMMKDLVPERIKQAPSLRTVYELVLSYPGIGPFLAFQYTIDLNYSSILDFDETDMVVAGPGALDGISKCFSDTGRATAEDVVHWMTDRQETEFARLGLHFDGLYGRRLQPIDCQNLFCEISKYARVAHPDIPGVANRTRIKQIYRPNNRPLPFPQFPARWGLRVQSAHLGPQKVSYHEPLQPSLI
ncbi:nucleotide kinase domain-containing protein [Bradyrhizobium sp. CB3481]|uniref:nucleotide kinase domain-containing protein n=1 Tax=Bradyrhizobium sp. CB3481 TaxID=3039158 RepID=UPI0024B0AE29|nr:nucleotide kinase domain-containing protein [Bradyrhizobium sp. CB3481]WFU14400.1 putative DNA base hypermodification protein [Bradyrhizobium sp. CB3481]